MNDAPVSRDPKSPDHSSSWDHSHQSYAYAPPLVAADEWIHENITNDPIGKIKRYFLGLFPILSWIYRYNLTWATGGWSQVNSLSDIRSHRRHHRWSCCGAAEHVVCKDCDFARSVRSLFVLRRRLHLLFLRYI